MSVYHPSIAAQAVRNDIFALRRECPASVVPADSAEAATQHPDVGTTLSFIELGSDVRTKCTAIVYLIGVHLVKARTE